MGRKKKQRHQHVKCTRINTVSQCDCIHYERGLKEGSELYGRIETKIGKEGRKGGRKEGTKADEQANYANPCKVIGRQQALFSR